MSDDTGRPRWLTLPGGTRLRRRAVPGVPDRALVTGPTGRFSFLPAADLDAAQRPGAAGDALRRKLAESGLLHGAPIADRPGDGPHHHVVFASTPLSTMSADTAGTVAARIAESPARFLRVDVHGADPAAEAPAVHTLVRTLRERCRAANRQLMISLFASPAVLLDEGGDALLDAGVTLAVPFDGPEAAHEANRAVTRAPPHAAVVQGVREVHARYAARGIAPSLAFVRGIVTVTPATIEAGPRAVIDAAADLGLVFVELRRPPGLAEVRDLADYLDFQQRFWDAILDVNLAGTQLVEMRLALHLEALSAAATSRAAPSPTSGEVLVHGPDGRVYAREAGPFLAEQGDDRFVLGHDGTQDIGALARAATTRADPGCAACTYDPYCGRGLLLHDTPETSYEARAFGTGACGASMGTLDDVLGRLASPNGPALRRAFKGWMTLHQQVAARLSGAPS